MKKTWWNKERINFMVNKYLYKVRDADGYFLKGKNNWVDSFEESDSYAARSTAERNLLKCDNPDYGSSDLEVVQYLIKAEEMNASSPQTYTQQKTVFGFPPIDEETWRETANREEEKEHVRVDGRHRAVASRIIADTD